MENRFKIQLSDVVISVLMFGVIVLDNGSLLMKLIKIFAIVVAFLYTSRRGKIVVNNYMWWFSLCSTYFICSCIWAYSRVTAFEMLQTIVINLLFIWSFLQVVGHKKENYDLFLTLLVVMPILYGVRLFLKYGVAVFAGLRYITDESTSMHNSIGMYAAFAMCIAILLCEMRKKTSRVWLVVGLIINCGLLILSGSRKSILFVSIPLVVYYVLKSKNPIKVFRNILMTCLGVYLMFVAIMEIPVLYEKVGSGIETLIVGLLDLGQTDGSTSARLRMIKWGGEIFKNRPFLGHGLENFKVLHYEEYRVLAIADNNYIELLVDQGIVGLCLYYSFHLVFLLRVMRSIINKKNNLMTNMILGIELAILVCDYGVCSYRNLYIQILLCCMWELNKNYSNKNSMLTSNA